MVSKVLSYLVDTHCHLNFIDFNQDRDLVVERARNNGITRIVNPGVDIQTSRSALDCAYAYPEVFAAVGVHPNDGSSWTNDSLGQIRNLAGQLKVVAIGEIGLDYYRDRVPKELQKARFREQLDLAAELKKPVIIHNRDASTDLSKMLGEWHDKLVSSGSILAESPGILHAFSGDIIFAKEMVDLNFKLGIGGSVTYKKSILLQSVVVTLPLECLVIETDSPFLTPLPYRGKRNEPANVRIVAEKIAELKADKLENVVISSASQAEKLFRWREIH